MHPPEHFPSGLPYISCLKNSNISGNGKIHNNLPPDFSMPSTAPSVHNTSDFFLIYFLLYRPQAYSPAFLCQGLSLPESAEESYFLTALYSYDRPPESLHHSFEPLHSSFTIIYARLSIYCFAISSTSPMPFTTPFCSQSA